jgi:transposase
MTVATLTVRVRAIEPVADIVNTDEPLRKDVESGESVVIPWRANLSRGLPDVDARTPCRGGSSGPSLSQRSSTWLATGCQWLALPKGLPSTSTAWDDLDLSNWDGIGGRGFTTRVSRGGARGRPERGDDPPVRPVDQPVGEGGVTLDPQGGAYPRAGLRPDSGNAAKKVTDRKRHIRVDILGFPLNVAVHPADVQGRDGIALVLDWRTWRRFSGTEGLSGHGQDRHLDPGDRQAPRPPSLRDLPKRWTHGSRPRAERTLAWVSRNRRLARDFERHARIAAAFIRLAMIRLMLRGLTRPQPCS